MPRTLPDLRSDRQKVKQIVLNLLSNALKFTPAGSVKIAASHDAKSRTVGISVSDTGVGIAPEDRLKVFEDFRQLDSSPARGYGGTGLGLSICRRLSQMLGGSIDLESEIGKGFDVHAASSGAAQKTMSTHNSNDALVLVVEDYQDAREMYFGVPAVFWLSSC